MDLSTDDQVGGNYGSLPRLSGRPVYTSGAPGMSYFATIPMKGRPPMFRWLLKLRRGAVARSRQHMGINFVLPVVTRKVDGWVVAYCPPLDVTSQGRSRAEAIAAVKEAVAAFIEYCIEHNTIDRVLRDRGFTQARPAEWGRSKDELIEVPIELFANASNNAHPLAHAC